MESVPGEYADRFAAFITHHPLEARGLAILPPEAVIRHQDRYWRIATETLCGDPVFLDPLQKGFPVYTAMAELGQDDRELIAISLDTFFAAVALLQTPDAEPRDILEQIDIVNQHGAELSFWAALLQLDDGDLEPDEEDSSEGREA